MEGRFRFPGGTEENQKNLRTSRFTVDSKLATPEFKSKMLLLLGASLLDSCSRERGSVSMELKWGYVSRKIKFSLKIKLHGCLRIEMCVLFLGGSVEHFCITNYIENAPSFLSVL